MTPLRQTPPPETVAVLNSDDLFTPFGFHRGNIITDTFAAEFTGDDLDIIEGQTHAVLYRAVCNLLLPEVRKAGHDIDVIWADTDNNPVRATTVDGVYLSRQDAKPDALPSVSVEVNRDALLGVLHYIRIATRVPTFA
ncbi:hypothetical protein [Leifsonia sp. Leaf264]|uniref:hypothetical protein n=1 Tax=Leifsonia sp. Leaf264 TaxID=1736314 RepID=UPI0006FFEE00|nr:hypothetical protein [Leifsonia sp. Leaf264]KQO98585.1 hypothetical protein ASF30_11020 [Leifsonia sp. Leaf264]